MQKISDRLIRVAELVPEGSRLADVGTDHGYVPIWLLEKGIIPSAIAMDVNRGPLLRARENRDRYGYQKVMELRLSNGLEKLRPGRPIRCCRRYGWPADDSDPRRWPRKQSGSFRMGTAAPVGDSIRAPVFDNPWL